MEIVTRQEALEQGLKRYFTGVACQHGHVTERYVSTTKCCACAVAYKKLYRAENADKLKMYNAEYHRKWYAENADKVKARHAEYYPKWYAENADKLKAKSVSYRAKNPDKVKAYNAKYRAKVAADLKTFRQMKQNAPVKAESFLHPDILRMLTA